MTRLAPPTVPFSLSQAREIVSDLYTPSSWIYWLDYGLTIIGAHILFIALATMPFWFNGSESWRWTLLGSGYTISILLYYRASIFIHELTHLRVGTFNAFRVFWNATYGIPLLVPSFLYFLHLDHHRRKCYGTRQDGEYVPLEYMSKWYIVLFMIAPLLLPALAIFRFLVLSSVGWLLPPMRRHVHRLRSSLAMDLRYERPLPTTSGLRMILLQEVSCFLWIVGVIFLLTTSLRETAWPLLVQGYATLGGIAMLNGFRALITHRWTGDETHMTFLQQLLDSVNFPRRGVGEMWAPVGQRFHATHHLFPSMPYHNLGIAHRRLMAQLPDDSPYRLTSSYSGWKSFADVWQRAGSRRHEHPIRWF